MKTKNKFNIIDTFVILFLLALIFGITFFVLHKSSSMYAERNEKTITYTVHILGVEEEHLSSFAEGEKMFNSSTLDNIGTVTKVVSEKALVNGNTASAGEAEGEYILDQTEAPGLYDVYITVTAKASIDGRGVPYINSRRITTGTSLYIRCGNYATQCFVTDFAIG